MMEIVIPGLIALATSTVSAWVTYLCTKKRYQAEVLSIEVDNVSKIHEYYKQALNDLNERWLAERSENDSYEASLDELNSKNRKLKQEVLRLQVAIDKLTLQNEQLKAQVHELTEVTAKLQLQLAGVSSTSV